ncbi:nitrate reductase [Polaromonas naphthalenivorans]|uniref:Assimilatory nitrate reductase (NADH) alpha subunit apoprotein n=1 Tax=Polaromonas naphthalenivorans (strain CJ2) TaxID=365044 RepID=A1VM40_POLNA|nr:nitrate reductase [Polaromonas naphthalenivorans]ABM36718.1 assimilatory nitrate reductase (NADH) alpha subunit apoprotein [Polaromonas naphthalenivorans CJ2]
MTETRSTCPYCGVGCGVIIESQGDDITGVRGDPDHPANFGRLCTKGSTLHLTASSVVTRQTRLLYPMRREHRSEAPQRASWDSALDFASESFAQIIREHGPDAVGFYISGQLLTEDYYVFNKLAKGLIGTNNIDSNSRLCMSSAVAGYKQTLGADAPPACYDDVKHAQCLFIVGSNTAYAHPILFRRIEDAKTANPALSIIYCDPRRTDTAEIADLYLPLQPGTDVMLFNGMLHIMLWEGWTDPAWIAAHTHDFDALKATVRDCTPDLVAQTCGIRKEDLFAAARLFATSAATLSLYCQGLNQSSSGTAKNAALINLHLATAQIGKPGAGPFSLTGQPNAMGGREVGGMANLMSGHRDLSNPDHRAEVAALWGVPSVPEKPGKTAVEMFQAAADGEIKALWIACTNPAQSMPDQALVRRALERAELVIVQEAFATTATCAWADLLLPATTWGEKTGTVTNSERCISRVRPAVAAPGETRHDWSIAAAFAQRLERLLPGRSPGALFPYSLTDPALGVETIWNEHRESTRGRDLDITGMSYAMLEQAPRQWPLKEGETTGKARLYEDGIFPTPDGKARFVNTVYKPVAEPRESRYPFSLTTGRLRDQWHGMSRTGTLGRLFGHVAEPSIQMNVQDMARRLLKEGELVHVTSKRGSIIVPVQASPEVAVSQAFMAMHWGSEYLSGQSSIGQPLAGVNALTTSAYCPSSKQPELKHAAVKILKAELPWSLLAMAWFDEGDALAAHEQLKALLTAFPFASCVPFSNNKPLTDRQGERTGLLFRAAAHEAPGEEILALLERIFGLNGSYILRYADRKKGQRRTIRLARTHDNAELTGFVLAGDTSAQAWITTLLKDELPAQAYGRLLLLPGAKPPVAVQSRGKVVCSCLNVTDTAIDEHLALLGQADTDEARLASLQGALKCGTSCGSCVPELKRRLRSASGTAIDTPASPRSVIPIKQVA